MYQFLISIQKNYTYDMMLGSKFSFQNFCRDNAQNVKCFQLVSNEITLTFCALVKPADAKDASACAFDNPCNSFAYEETVAVSNNPSLPI